MSDTESDTASSVGSIVEDASEPDTTSFKDLFSDRQWTRVADMVEYNKAEIGFDLPATIKGLGSGAATNTHLCLLRLTLLG
jgi:protein arginine N-methyltransferase 3